MMLISIFGGGELIILLLVFLLPILALIDIVRGTFKENIKFLWILIVLFSPFIGPIIYFVVGRKQKIYQ